MSENYLHSVHVIAEACNGCVGCVKYCPTEAIRVRGGKAEIVATRCVDCGECIRRCPTHAMVAQADTLEQLNKYEYNVALPAPSLYAQFPADVKREAIWQGLKTLGFDDIFDLSAASDYIAREIEDYISEYTEGRKPLISSACPAVLRLIQVKFPELIKQVIPILAPGEAAAIYTRREVAKKMNLPNEKIGIWFITPCPAKGTNIHQSVDVKHTEISGSISIASIFGELTKAIGEDPVGAKMQGKITTGSSYGVGWGKSGGEVRAVGLKDAITVQGIDQVYDALEQISMNKLPDVDYVECYACQGGCIGGPFAAENRFVGEKNLRKRVEALELREGVPRREAMEKSMTCENWPTSAEFVKKLEPRPMMQLDEDITTAIAKLEKMDAVLESLPGLDCGACGAPTCQSLAEDIVQGNAHETDCIFVLRKRVKQFARGMIELSTQIPLMGNDKDEEEEKE